MIPFESDSRIFARVFGFEWTEEFGRGYAESMHTMRAAMRARLPEDENGDEIEPEIEASQ